MKTYLDEKEKKALLELDKELLIQKDKDNNLIGVRIFRSDPAIGSSEFTQLTNLRNAFLKENEQ